MTQLQIKNAPLFYYWTHFVRIGAVFVLQLGDTKGTDNTTLTHYLVTLLQSKFPEVADYMTELSAVPRASKSAYCSFREPCVLLSLFSPLSLLSP